MKRIVFATNNPNKLRELRELTAGQYDIVGLAEIGCHEDVPETSDTIRGNAIQKARYVADHYGVTCFADDTGLEVDALGGEPGVYSARYAGEAKDSKANMRKLLAALEGVADRKAHFTTWIALAHPGDAEVELFEGDVHGVITDAPSGDHGFGYDPIFRPDGYDRTFAELSADEKNLISHRGRATRKLIAYLTGAK